MAQEQSVKDKPKEVVYFVNGEAEETSEKKLTAGAILANANFDPADWSLSGDAGGKDFETDDLVEIHKDERFTAKRKGPTQAS